MGNNKQEPRPSLQYKKDSGSEGGKKTKILLGKAGLKTNFRRGLYAKGRLKRNRDFKPT